MTADMLLRMAFALLMVLGLMGLFAYALRRFGPRLGLAFTPPAQGEKRQLQVTENLALDARHRALVLRCGESEHVVILGGSQPVVVQSKVRN